MPIAQAYVVSPTHLSKVTSDLKQNWKNLKQTSDTLFGHSMLVHVVWYFLFVLLCRKTKKTWAWKWCSKLWAFLFKVTGAFWNMCLNTRRTLVTDAITLFLNQAPLSYNLNIGTVKEYARTEQHDRSYNIEHGRYPPTYVRVFLLVVDQK